MDISEKTSQKIKNMSLLCAVLVVSIHVSWPHEQPFSAGWWMYQIFTQNISRIAVPFFFVVSGFFLARHFDEGDWYHHEMVKRVKTLLVPFVFWSIISVLHSSLLSIAADKIAHRPFGTSIYFMQGSNWLRILGFDLTDCPLHFPLWYVRNLFLFVMTAFVFRYGIEKFGHAWLVVAFAFNLLYEYIPCKSACSFFSWGFSASGIFYFSVGILIQRFPVKIWGWESVIFCGLIGIGLLVLKVVFAYHAWQFETSIGKLALPFLLYFTWGVMPTFKWPQWLTACSFPIFLIHIIARDYIGIAMNYVPTGKIVAAFVTLGGNIVASIAAAVVLRRFFPRFAKVIFGGR